MIEKEEYEEDHADEERMFSEMDRLLIEFREYLVQANNNNNSSNTDDDTQQQRNNTAAAAAAVADAMNGLAKAISDQTTELSQHLMAHLEKEETECMPLVVKHLSKQEIHDLVGQIMGKRSADTIAQIMTMAVQNLNEVDRLEMVKYMKDAMSGTYFDRWLLMSGWMATSSHPQEEEEEAASARQDGTLKDVVKVEDDDDDRKRAAEQPIGIQPTTVGGATAPVAAAAQDSKRVKTEDNNDIASAMEASMGAAISAAAASTSAAVPETTAVVAVGQHEAGSSITSQSELEKFIRAIATNPGLTPQQKNATIQGLRDSVWKSNQRYREIHQGPPTVVNNAITNLPPALMVAGPSQAAPAASGLASVDGSASSRTNRRVTPPSMYYKKNAAGKVELVWNSDAAGAAATTLGAGNAVDVPPLFSATELAPTFHDGAASSKLGCPHYARGCKLRHPKSGRLYACRVCCEQERELPMKDKDEPLDRYAVTEVMCMKCHALQPAEDRCINPDCEGSCKPFAKYFCRICHLYDDGADKSIFHCPYCNCCRLGKGLGIDFRHCMRCNACVSLSDDDHQCIPQKLQGSCPICHESLFQSTEPLRGLKCGHVMHLSCFTEYRRGHSYTCPLCMRSMEDMKDYFAMLDTAVRMQPMPAAYLSTMSNIYCQDCGKTGQVQYHFVGLKCSNCDSYNTREMGRVDVSR